MIFNSIRGAFIVKSIALSQQIELCINYKDQSRVIDHKLKFLPLFSKQHSTFIYIFVLNSLNDAFLCEINIIMHLCLTNDVGQLLSMDYGDQIRVSGHKVKYEISITPIFFPNLIFYIFLLNFTKLILLFFLYFEVQFCRNEIDLFLGFFTFLDFKNLTF